MLTDAELAQAVISRTRQVPLPAVIPGDGAVVTRQLDAALVSAGFKMSRALVDNLGGRDTGQVLDIGVGLLAAARKMAGDHVRHNPYFKDFPFNVPDTMGFWASLMAQALVSNAPVNAFGGMTVGLGEAIVTGQMIDIGGGELVDAGSLLSLPGYGTVQHTYEEMLDAHQALASSAGDRMTMLHPGGTLEHEARELYLRLAGSRVPLAGEDLDLLAVLADTFPYTVPESVPVRENRAVINKAAVTGLHTPPAVDTVTDVLRLAVALSGGDVSLQKPPRFRSLPRAQRAVLMAALDRVVEANAAKLADVSQYAEEWKRLGERLHPHEYPQYAQGQRVFAVARHEEKVPSYASVAEYHMRAGHPGYAGRVLASAAPGVFVRSLDRLLRTANPGEATQVLTALSAAAPRVSCRVLLSAREHFGNRSPRDAQGLPRLFANRRGRAWVRPEDRLGVACREDVVALLDSVIMQRMPAYGRVIVDPAALGVALPLSGKPAAPGLGVMPRGSVSDVVPGAQDVLVFFNYWRQQSHRTDYDLSALMTDREFTRTDWVSWQNFHSEDAAATYSGDITNAPNGATEFISFSLRQMHLPVIVPQVLIYSGEAFDEAAESFCGYMLRGADQRGAPFEAATVRMKSDMRGSGRVAMPLAFVRGDDGRWRAKWLHFYLKGHPQFNVVQGNKVTASLLARTVIEREYLQVRYLSALLGARTPDGIAVPARDPGDAAVYADGTTGTPLYIGLDRPEGMPPGAKLVTLENLSDLIPD